MKNDQSDFTQSRPLYGDTGAPESGGLSSGAESEEDESALQGYLAHKKMPTPLGTP